jgi:hypothetical protein
MYIAVMGLGRTGARAWCGLNYGVHIAKARIEYLTHCYWLDLVLFDTGNF